METNKNIDVEMMLVDKISPHPNADKLEIVNLKGYQAVYSKGELKVGDLVLYIKTDAQIDLDVEWSKGIHTYLSSNGRVKTVKLRGEFSEGIIVTLDKLGEYFNLIELGRMSNIELATTLGIKHYEMPIRNCGNLQAKGDCLPYELPKTDQENVQSIDRDEILGKRYLVTRKKDGSSCTIAIHKTENDYEVSITSRSVNLKIDADNVFTRAATPIVGYVLDCLKQNETLLQNDNILVIRGEVCANSIQKKAINIDSVGEPTMFVFEAFIMDKPGLISYSKRTYLNVDSNNDFAYSILPAMKTVPRICVVDSLNEDDIDKYLKAPVSDGEGVVLWELDDNNQFTGKSFKIRSKEYDSKM